MNVEWALNAWIGNPSPVCIHAVQCGRALAIERVQLVKQAEHAQILQAREGLERALLNSISHDLRTPLVTITGALDTLMDKGYKLDGEARMYHLDGAPGEVGFISSVTAPFCAACARARLTADGRLRLCLLRDKEVDLLTPLRAGASLDDLRQIILDGIWEKPWGHGLAEGEFAVNRVMSEIGG